MSGEILSKKIILFDYFVVFIYSQAVFAAEYPLGAGDEIEITVFQHPELLKQAVISESGKVNFALIGTVDLKGKTESEVAKTLTDAYSSGGFVNNPEVFVVVNYLSIPCRGQTIL